MKRNSRKQCQNKYGIKSNKKNHAWIIKITAMNC